jgi:hypothetical protein
VVGKDRLAGTVDRGRFLQYLVAKGKLTGAEMANGAAIGVEPARGDRPVRIERWSVILLRGSSMMTAGSTSATIRDAEGWALVRKGAEFMSRTLSQFAIVPNGSGEYILNLEDDDGESVEFIASYEQLDLVIEAVQEQLDMDEEEALAVEDEGEAPEEK